MRDRTSRFTAINMAMLVLATASACSGPEEVAGTSAPHLASHDEASQAAAAVLDRYAALSDRIGADGGLDPGRVFEVVAEGEWAADEVAAFEELEAGGLRLVGESTLAEVRLHQYDEPAALIQLHMCLDVSGTRLS